MEGSRDGTPLGEGRRPAFAILGRSARRPELQHPSTRGAEHPKKHMLPQGRA